LKVWWSCDQQTIGDFGGYARYMDKIVGISPCHSRYFSTHYGINNTIVIDLPIRLDDFEGLKFDKTKNRLIFTSVPARGLDNLLRIYPKIKNAVPDVDLVITADYRLWGVAPSNEHFRVKWMHQSNVNYLGAIPRGRLIEEQMKADLLVYPCNYEELFCVAVAEAQCLGAYPVTSDAGALETTNMGTIVYGNSDHISCDDQFANTVVALLEDRKVLEVKRADNKLKAKMRFAPANILEQWETKVFK
jgi:glycosyltransferase involved in cell wall biosynthesis